MPLTPVTFCGLSTIDLTGYNYGEKGRIFQAVNEVITGKKSTVMDIPTGILDLGYTNGPSHFVFISSPHSEFAKNDLNNGDSNTLHKIYIATGTGQEADKLDQWLKEELEKNYRSQGLISSTETLESKPNSFYELNNSENSGRYCYDGKGNTLVQFNNIDAGSKDKTLLFGFFNQKKQLIAVIYSNENNIRYQLLTYHNESHGPVKDRYMNNFILEPLKNFPGQQIDNVTFPTSQSNK